MDDLIGTQVPERRLTDPHEAVRALERVVPGLLGYRRAVPAVIDWRVLQARQGAALPADFRLLAELYPAFELGDFLRAGLPRPGMEDRWSDEDLLETLAEWCEDADLAVPLHPFSAPGGLLPWATSNQGDFFLWSTHGQTPEDWSVTVASRSGGWWHYTGGAVQFLAKLVGGAVDAWGLPPVRPTLSGG